MKKDIIRLATLFRMLTKLEIRRQLGHLFFGIIIVLLLYFNIIDAIVLGLSTICMIMISYFIKKGYKILIFSYLFDKLERGEEKKSLRARGSIFYLIGSTVVVALFQKNIAMASIMILAFGDSVSRLTGPFGYIKHPFNNKKFLEGVLLGAMAAFFGAMFFVPWTYAAAASIISMLIESIDVKIKGIKLDDNLTIPLVSGLVMLIISKLV